MRFLRIFLLLAFTAIVVSCSKPAPASPKLTLSSDRVYHRDLVTMRGTGFTPKADVRSHLKRPDGTEFPVLPMLTDDKGEFTHDVDTLLLFPGTHELWVIDSTTGVTSNIAKFEMSIDQPPPAEKKSY